jgi:hypothetical protein
MRRSSVFSERLIHTAQKLQDRIVHDGSVITEMVVLPTFEGG